MCRRPCSKPSRKKIKMSPQDTCPPAVNSGLLPSSPGYGDRSVPMATRLLNEQKPQADTQKKANRSFDPRKIFCSSCLVLRRSKRNKDAALIEADYEDVRPYLDDAFVKERLIDSDMASLVAQPDNVDRNEWLATHTFSFVEHINLIYGCLPDYCQPAVCSTMSGPGNVKYQWLNDRSKKSKCSAPQYINNVMSYAHRCIYSESIFPTKYGHGFPASFVETVQRIHRLLLHVLAHVYQSHASTVKTLSLLGALNSVTHHFLLFSKTFHLIEDLEMDVLNDLYERLNTRTLIPAILLDIDAGLQAENALLMKNSSETISAATIHTTSTSCCEFLANERISEDTDKENLVSEQMCDDNDRQNLVNDRYSLTPIISVRS